LTVKALLLCLLAITVEGTGELPFTPASLEEALRLRGVDPEAQVELRAVGVDAVEITCDARQRVVPLFGRTGPAAARWVALAVVELLEPVPGLTAPAPRVVTPAPTPTPAPPPEPQAPAISLAVMGAARGGTSFERPWLGGAAEVGIRIWRPLTAHLGLGVAMGPSDTRAEASLRTTVVPIRFGVGYRLEAAPLELRVGGLAAPLQARGDRADAPYSRWLAVGGVGASAVGRWPVRPGWAVRAELGLDVFVNQLDLQVGGARLSLTDRAGARAAVGVEWEALP